MHDEAVHDHAHGHSHGGGEDARRLGLALALILAFMAGEVVAGILAHSLALLSDAAHMLTDAGALALSLVVLRLAAQPAGGNRTFGLRRSEILSAQANGAALLVLAGFIVYGAIRRPSSAPACACPCAWSCTGSSCTLARYSLPNLEFRHGSTSRS